MPLNGNSMSEGACYQLAAARDMAMLSLMRTAHKLLSQSTMMVKLDEWEGLRDNGFPIEQVTELFRHIDPPFLDAFRTATAFENLIKAELLDDGMVVHEFTKSPVRFKPLAEEQKRRPISVAELRDNEGDTWRERGPFTIASLTTKTIPFANLIDSRTGYPQALSLSTELVHALNTTREHRNTVHLVMNDIGRFNDRVVADLRCMCDAFNSRLLPRYERLLTRLEHLRGLEKYYLREI